MAMQPLSLEALGAEAELERDLPRDARIGPARGLDPRVLGVADPVDAADRRVDRVAVVGRCLEQQRAVDVEEAQHCREP